MKRREIVAWSAAAALAVLSRPLLAQTSKLVVVYAGAEN